MLAEASLRHRGPTVPTSFRQFTRSVPNYRIIELLGSRPAPPGQDPPRLPAMSSFALVLKNPPPVDAIAMCPSREKRVHVPYECGPGRCFFPDPVAPHGSHERGNSPPFDNLIILPSLPCLVWPLFCKVPRPWMPPPCGRQGKNVSTSPMNAAPGVVLSRTPWSHTDPTSGEAHPHPGQDPPQAKKRIIELLNY